MKRPRGWRKLLLMTLSGFRWSVGALLFGWAVRAWGASIPVYREYSRPIQLYDARGGRTGFDGEAPDRQAWQLLRDTQAREGLMGREAVLGMDFNSGDSVFGLMSRAPMGGTQPLAARDDDERGRSRSQTPNRNWLVQSLSLPTLGDKGSNTTGRSQAGSKSVDTGWGWLADEVVAGVAGGGGTVNPDWPDGEGGGGWNPDALNPFTGQSSAASPDRAAGAPSQAGPAEGTDAPARDRSVGLMRDQAGTDARAGSSRMDFGQANPKPDSPLPPPMSQTREMLADIMVSAKPDQMPWQDAAEQRTTRESPIGAGGRAFGRQSVITRTETPSRRGGESFGLSSRAPATRRMSANPTAIGTAATAPRGNWQGGWNASPMRESGLTTYGSPDRPVSTPITPPATRSPPSFPANAGAKPGWY
ncbi:MAG: hypothetical protein PHO14_07900 [Kiritimatiellae bacterium]|nr:hypothetical protein [Kiritimatiellia bacterium]